jgi:hypothetical protein
MAKEFTKTVVELPKEAVLTVHEVEDNGVIVNVDGWRMRVYFDKGVTKEGFHYGKEIVVNYFGDISDVHSIKFEKLK